MVSLVGAIQDASGSFGLALLPIVALSLGGALVVGLLGEARGRRPPRPVDAFGQFGSSARGIAVLDAGTMVEAYVAAAPDRLVWGTDWPHPTVSEGAKPDDAHLTDLISGCIGRDDRRKAIFVENAAGLYGF